MLNKLIEVEPDHQLTFVKRTPGLMQLKVRFPNDGLFPAIKAVEDMTVHDVPILIKQKQYETLYNLIQHSVQATETPLVNALVSQLAGSEATHNNVDLVELIHSKLTSISELNYNLMTQHACKRPEFLQQILFETTVTGVKLDLQTWL